VDDKQRSPTSSAEKGFLMAKGKLVLECTLDKEINYHGQVSMLKDLFASLLMKGKITKTRAVVLDKSFQLGLNVIILFSNVIY
jgi:hypothetical protein